jgi:hypothetical protein
VPSTGQLARQLYSTARFRRASGVFSARFEARFAAALPS